LKTLIIYANQIGKGSKLLSNYTAFIVLGLLGHSRTPKTIILNNYRNCL
jgi:hypothetical protein